MFSEHPAQTHWYKAPLDIPPPPSTRTYGACTIRMSSCPSALPGSTCLQSRALRHGLGRWHRASGTTAKGGGSPQISPPGGCTARRGPAPHPCSSHGQERALAEPSACWQPAPSGSLNAIKPEWVFLAPTPPLGDVAFRQNKQGGFAWACGWQVETLRSLSGKQTGRRCSALLLLPQALTAAPSPRKLPETDARPSVLRE